MLIHIEPVELIGVLRRMKDLLTKDGHAAVVIVEGEGGSEKMNLLEVNGRELRRTVYLYNQDYLTDIAERIGLEYVRKGFLKEKLIQYGWKNYIFKLI